MTNRERKKKGKDKKGRNKEIKIQNTKKIRNDLEMKRNNK